MVASSFPKITHSFKLEEPEVERFTVIGLEVLWASVGIQKPWKLIVLIGNGHPPADNLAIRLK